jgi:Zn-dependent alcohol dehydrogenase
LAWQVEKGSTAAVFGLGTIGLAVVDALREAGARRIIGVDTDEGKYARGKEWGCTDLINPKKFDKPIQVLAASASLLFVPALPSLFCLQLAALPSILALWISVHVCSL